MSNNYTLLVICCQLLQIVIVYVYFLLTKTTSELTWFGLACNKLKIFKV